MNPLRRFVQQSLKKGNSPGLHSGKKDIGKVAKLGTEHLGQPKGAHGADGNRVQLIAKVN